MEWDRRRRIHAARALALIADAVELGLLPLFVEGGLSPLNDVLDVAVAGALVYLVGWHWAFAPAFMAEMVPGLTLAPTWTAAVFLATHEGTVPAKAEPAAPAAPPQPGPVLPPGPVEPREPEAP